jgi:hypothetical protein
MCRFFVLVFWKNYILKALFDNLKWTSTTPEFLESILNIICAARKAVDPSIEFKVTSLVSYLNFWQLEALAVDVKAKSVGVACTLAAKD